MKQQLESLRANGSGPVVVSSFEIPGLISRICRLQYDAGGLSEVLVLKLAIPVLHVSNSMAAEEFYCKRLGFRTEFAHRVDDAKADPCYIGLTRDGVWLHVSSFSGDGISGGVVNLIVEDVDALHAELVEKGV
jgi:hypothetical protein